MNGSSSIVTVTVGVASISCMTPPAKTISMTAVVTITAIVIVVVMIGYGHFDVTRIVQPVILSIVTVGVILVA